MDMKIWIMEVKDKKYEEELAEDCGCKREIS